MVHLRAVVTRVRFPGAQQTSHQPLRLHLPHQLRATMVGTMGRGISTSRLRPAHPVHQHLRMPQHRLIHSKRSFPLFGGKWRRRSRISYHHLRNRHPRRKPLLLSVKHSKHPKSQNHFQLPLKQRAHQTPLIIWRICSRPSWAQLLTDRLLIPCPIFALCSRFAMFFVSVLLSLLPLYPLPLFPCYPLPDLPSWGCTSHFAVFYLLPAL